MSRAIAPLLALIFLTDPATADTVVGNRVFLDFAFEPSVKELAAAKRWGREYFAKADAAGRPVTVRVARTNSTSLLSLESVAICDRVKACPLLVFRDFAARPVLNTTAFQNVVIEYRNNETYLSYRLWDTVNDCRISNVGKALCRKTKAK